MIDNLDTQTNELPLETKRGRGRPKTGTALTPAKKQKAYRERLKRNVTKNTVESLDEKLELRAQLLAAMEEIESLKGKLRAEYDLGEKARKQVIALEKQIRSNGTVTENEGPLWTMERKWKGKRWANQLAMTTENLDGSTRNWNFEEVKKFVDDQQSRTIDGIISYRAVREDGKTYVPKVDR